MADPVTLHNGYYLIDTHAWLAQRTGERHDSYSTQLADFARCDVFDQYTPAMDTAARMQLWCAARGFALHEEVASIEHDDECLAAPVTIVLATTTSVPAQALALVSIGGGTPQVYADITDDSFWQTVGIIAITCLVGHRWSWDGGRYLYADDGTEHCVSDLYGRDASVISTCHACQAYDNGDFDEMCPCPGYAIYCPTCAVRCDVGLPEIPTMTEAPR
ncbi:hypothetical protein [Paractinoplanes globisporus]|uniref:Uncharacterized protein n=1 Tax=Paractinoplanes globisporus TaxID=113565 RepID=A0ABW6WEW8_9ACTN|nr:hypothetical protein [Actinoplanes globisporus]